MERVFRFGSPASCLTSFRYGDTDYQPGDAFPYQRLGVERHQALGLWFNGMIDFGEPARAGTMQTATVQMPGVESDRRERRFNKHRR